MPNQIKAALQAGETVLSCFISFPSPHLVEMAGYAGFDAVLIDMEHGAISLGEMEGLTRAAAVAGVVPLVRIPENRRILVGQALDSGAEGLLIPHVDSAADAEQAVAATRFEPHGSRGLGLSVRSARYGTLGREKFLAQDPFVMLQIESAQAVERVDEIAATPGVDLLFIGPSDLSSSLGVPGQVEHPVVQEAIDVVVRAAQRRNVPVGIFTSSAANAAELAARGFQLVLTGSTGIVQGALSGYVRDFRSHRRS